MEGITDRNSKLETNNVRHHLNCPRIISTKRKRSIQCQKLLAKFRVSNSKLKNSARKCTKKRIGSLLTPNRRLFYNGILKSKRKIIRTNKRYVYCISLCSIGLLQLFHNEN